MIDLHMSVVKIYVFFVIMVKSYSSYLELEVFEYGSVQMAIAPRVSIIKFIQSS